MHAGAPPAEDGRGVRWTGLPGASSSGAVLLVLRRLGSVAVLQRDSAAPDLSTPEGVVRAYYAGPRRRPAGPGLGPPLQHGQRRGRRGTSSSSGRPATGRRGDARITVDSVEIEGRHRRRVPQPDLRRRGPPRRRQLVPTVTVRLDRGRRSVADHRAARALPDRFPAPRPCRRHPSRRRAPSHAETGDMNVARRLYFYGVAFASLVMLAVGLSGLGGVLVDALAAGAPRSGTGRSRRPARRLHPERRPASWSGCRSGCCTGAWPSAPPGATTPGARRPLRRLYLYAVLLTFALRWAFSAHDLLERRWAPAGRRPLHGTGRRGASSRRCPGSSSPAPCGPTTARSVVVDRRLVGEVGAARHPAPLVRLRPGPRRAAASCSTARRRAAPDLGGRGRVALGRRCWAIAGGLRPRRGDDRSDRPRAVAGALERVGGAGRRRRRESRTCAPVLRPVYLFLALGVSVGFTLTARRPDPLLRPGPPAGGRRAGRAIGGPLLLALAGPVRHRWSSTASSWLYHRRRWRRAGPWPSRELPPGRRAPALRLPRLR